MSGASVAMAVATALVLCAACSSDEQVWSSAEDGDCTSTYEPVASARTWRELKQGMVAYEGWGPVASVRTQERGDDVGVGDRDAVRVVDLLNGKGRRLIQAEVWRTDAGTLRAGVWSQCTD